MWFRRSIQACEYLVWPQDRSRFAIENRGSEEASNSPGFVVPRVIFDFYYSSKFEFFKLFVFFLVFSQNFDIYIQLLHSD